MACTAVTRTHAATVVSAADATAWTAGTAAALTCTSTACVHGTVLLSVHTTLTAIVTMHILWVHVASTSTNVHVTTVHVSVINAAMHVVATSASVVMNAWTHGWTTVLTSWQSSYGLTVHVESVMVVVVNVVVTTYIVMIDSWKTVEEMGMCIVIIDTECPTATVDVCRTEEILTCQEIIPLPIIENIAQVFITAIEIDVVCTVDRTQCAEIIVVDFIYVVNLIFGQVKFVCHLVGQEACLFA